MVDGYMSITTEAVVNAVICRQTERKIKCPRLAGDPGFRSKFALTLLVGFALLAQSAEALEWRWRYQGEGVGASGTFTTGDAPDAGGFYEIIAIAGETNGVAITGLQSHGTAIPGNDGYPVDNLVRVVAPQLTKNGFGYALANGTYANPFYGAHFAKPDTYAFFSDPPNSRTSEPAVAFTATIVP
jgi:hypothetical protein